VTERAACEPRHAAGMTVGERDYETIGGCVRKPIYAVRREIVVLPLFAVGNDRRACGFKSLYGVSNRCFIERSEVRILAIAFCDALDQINRSRNTSNWLGGYTDWYRLGHIARLSHASPAHDARALSTITSKLPAKMIPQLVVGFPGSEHNIKMDE